MTGEEIEAIVNGYHGDAFGILGPHTVRKKNNQPRWEVRAFLPHADTAAVVVGGSSMRNGEEARAGLLRAPCWMANPRPTQLRAQLWDGREVRDRRSLPLRAADFRFRSLPALRRHALRGLADARRAHRGESKACAACASRCGRRMRRRSRWPASSTIGTRAAIPCGGATAASGRSSCPGSREGASYKYNVRSRFAAYQQLKADPYAFYCELPPKSASVVWDIDKYEWQDAAWMRRAPRSTC